MTRTFTAGALAALMLASPLQAEVGTDTLQIYAAMAKLEANKAEAAGAVILAAAAQGDEEILAEAREDYQSDLGQIQEYIAFLQEAPLSETQATAIASFVEQWEPVAAAGTELLNQDDDTIRNEAYAWWESLDGLDDLVDDQLEAILADAGAEILE